jgi:dihydroneopterin aldolase
MPGTLFINNIQIYAYHGCLTEEAVIGGNYVVDVTITTDFEEASRTDELSKTVDYCRVFEIVEREMKQRSRLIEHVAKRIIVSLRREIPGIEKAEVRLTKIAPPVNGPVGSVSVVVTD